MDSSKIFGGSEECHSSESGWTMYICSPIHGGDDDDGDGDGDGNSYYHHHGYGDGHNDGSDDSMASDASSHPRHEVKECLNKKGKKAAVEKRCEERKKKNEGKVKGETVPAVQSGNKVRKNFWIGKRK